MIDRRSSPPVPSSFYVPGTVLSAAWHHGAISVWFVSAQPAEWVTIVWTGNEPPAGRFVDTVMSPDEGMVCHVFAGAE